LRSTRLSREGRRFKKHLLQFMHVCLSNAQKVYPWPGSPTPASECWNPPFFRNASLTFLLSATTHGCSSISTIRACNPKYLRWSSWSGYGIVVNWTHNHLEGDHESPCPMHYLFWKNTLNLIKTSLETVASKLGKLVLSIVTHEPSSAKTRTSSCMCSLGKSHRWLDFSKMGTFGF
jgi:hypothetical protein